MNNENSEEINDNKQVPPSQVALAKKKKTFTKRYKTEIGLAINFAAVCVAAWSLKTSHESLALVKASEQSNNRKDSILISHMQTLANASVKNYQEIKDEFNVGNEPYLQLTPTINADEKTKQWLGYRCTVTNIGRHPAILINKQMMVTLRGSIMPGDAKFNSVAIPYVTEELISNLEPLLMGNNPFTDKMFDSVNKFDAPFYIVGILKFRNLITNKLKSYEFKIMVTKQGPWYLINRNQYIN